VHTNQREGLGDKITTETTGGLMLRGILGKVLFVVYVVVGLIVASSHHYFAHLDGIKPIASAVLAVLLWPLVLLGVSLHIK
jgi:hypothetical protein